MMKINKIALLFLLFFLQIPVFSQYENLPIQHHKKYYRGHITLNYKVLNKKIQRAFKYSKCFSSKDTTLRLLVTFCLYTEETIAKEEYENGSFLKKLNYGAHRPYKNRDKRKRILPKMMVEGNISVNSKEEVVAFYSYAFGCFMSKQEYYERYKTFLNLNCRVNSYEEYCQYIKNIRSEFSNDKLLNYIWDKGNLFIFQLKTGYSTYFIINEQLDISVFYEESEGHYNVLPIKEFIDKHWDRFSKGEGKWITH